MMTWLAILGFVLFVLGDLVKDANLEDFDVTSSFMPKWASVGKFMMWISLIIFIFFLIVSIIEGIQQL